MSEIIEVFTEMVRLAFPYAFVFAMGAKLVNGFLHMAFNGEVKL